MSEKEFQLTEEQRKALQKWVNTEEGTRFVLGDQFTDMIIEILEKETHKRDNER